jgi:hypothetical protein
MGKPPLRSVISGLALFTLNMAGEEEHPSVLYLPKHRHVTFVALMIQRRACRT